MELMINYISCYFASLSSIILNFSLAKFTLFIKLAVYFTEFISAKSVIRNNM